MQKVDLSKLKQAIIEQKTRPVPMCIILQEEYTPRDYLAQRYRMTIRRGPNGGGPIVADRWDILSPIMAVTDAMRAFGIPASQVIIRLPE